MTEPKNIKAISEGVINKMIPNNKNFLTTKTNTILNMDKFLKIIKKNKIFKKKLQHFNNFKRKKNNDYHYFINEIFKSKIIENDIQEKLLEDYFLHKKVIKKLEIKTQKFLKYRKQKNIDYLLRYVKKSKLKYKNI